MQLGKRRKRTVSNGIPNGSKIVKDVVLESTQLSLAIGLGEMAHLLVPAVSKVKNYKYEKVF